MAGALLGWVLLAWSAAAHPFVIACSCTTRQIKSDPSTSSCPPCPVLHTVPTDDLRKTRHWSGRLGNFVLSSAPAADVVSSGAVLHLWKATGSSATDSMSWQQDAAAQGGNVHEGGSAIDEVAVRYFTAEGGCWWGGGLLGWVVGWCLGA